MYYYDFGRSDELRTRSQRDHPDDLRFLENNLKSDFRLLPVLEEGHV